MVKERHTLRWVPSGYEPYQVEVPAFSIYAGEKPGGGVLAIAYAGKALKHAWHHSFKTRERFEEYARQWVEALKAKAARKQAAAEARRSYQHDYKVGDILQGSWGYDQTNQEFAEVVEVRGKMVVIRSLETEMLNYGAMAMSAKVKPVPGRYTGEPMTRKVGPGGWVRLHNSATLHRWDGVPRTESWYG